MIIDRMPIKLITTTISTAVNPLLRIIFCNRVAAMTDPYLPISLIIAYYTISKITEQSADRVSFFS